MSDTRFVKGLSRTTSSSIEPGDTPNQKPPSALRDFLKDAKVVPAKTPVGLDSRASDKPGRANRNTQKLGLAPMQQLHSSSTGGYSESQDAPTDEGFLAVPAAKVGSSMPTVSEPDTKTHNSSGADVHDASNQHSASPVNTGSEIAAASGNAELDVFGVVSKLAGFINEGKTQSASEKANNLAAALPDDTKTPENLARLKRTIEDNARDVGKLMRIPAKECRDVTRRLQLRAKLVAVLAKTGELKKAEVVKEIELLRESCATRLEKYVDKGSSPSKSQKAEKIMEAATKLVAKEVMDDARDSTYENLTDAEAQEIIDQLDFGAMSKGNLEKIKSRLKTINSYLNREKRKQYIDGLLHFKKGDLRDKHDRLEMRAKLLVTAAKIGSDNEVLANEEKKEALAREKLFKKLEKIYTDEARHAVTSTGATLFDGLRQMKFRAFDYVGFDTKTEVALPLPLPQIRAIERNLKSHQKEMSTLLNISEAELPNADQRVSLQLEVFRHLALGRAIKDIQVEKDQKILELAQRGSQDAIFQEVKLLLKASQDDKIPIYKLAATILGGGQGQIDEHGDISAHSPFYSYYDGDDSRDFVEIVLAATIFGSRDLQVAGNGVEAAATGRQRLVATNVRADNAVAVFWQGGDGEQRATLLTYDEAQAGDVRAKLNSIDPEMKIHSINWVHSEPVASNQNAAIEHNTSSQDELLKLAEEHGVQLFSLIRPYVPASEVDAETLSSPPVLSIVMSAETPTIVIMPTASHDNYERFGDLLVELPRSQMDLNRAVETYGAREQEQEAVSNQNAANEDMSFNSHGRTDALNEGDTPEFFSTPRQNGVIEEDPDNPDNDEDSKKSTGAKPQIPQTPVSTNIDTLFETATDD